jgi:hypothetical protein
VNRDADEAAVHRAVPEVTTDIDGLLKALRRAKSKQSVAVIGSQLQQQAKALRTRREEPYSADADEAAVHRAEPEVAPEIDRLLKALRRAKSKQSVAVIGSQLQQQAKALRTRRADASS